MNHRERTESETLVSSDQDNFGRRLQVAVNLAVFAASIGVLLLVAQRLLPGPAPASSPAYSVGESVGPISGVDLSSSRQTLVMALREGCRFCEESMPFYQKLTSRLIQMPPSEVRVIVVSTDQSEVFARYLQGRSVQVNQVVKYQLGELKIPGTPFLFVVDKAGRVTHVWRGRLDAVAEEDVVRVLGMEGMS